MISDKLSNISNYKEIPQSVVDFLRKIDKNIHAGHNVISDDIYANVDIYTTKTFENCRMEAHDKYIDIQLLLEGFECLNFVDREHLSISEKYDENHDVVFFENPEYFNTVYLDCSNFVLLYPNEAHRPQIAVNEQLQIVKKVVVKIKVK